MAYQAKRQFFRRRLREGVQIKGTHGLEYATYEDICPGGLKVYLEHPLELKNLLKLSFSIPRDRRNLEVQCCGRVVWCVERSDEPGCFEVGLEFVGLSDTARQHIQELVDQSAQSL